MTNATVQPIATYIYEGCKNADFQIQALEDYSMESEVGITTYRRFRYSKETQMQKNCGHEDFYFC
jgi:hypothetical protein